MILKRETCWVAVDSRVIESGRSTLIAVGASGRGTDADTVTLTKKQVRLLNLALAIVLHQANRPEGPGYETLEDASAAVSGIFDEVLPGKAPQQPRGLAH